MPEERGRQPRPFWSGTISFGLVSVPVNLFPAQRGAGVPLRLLDPEGRPLARRYYCPAEEAELEGDEIVRGYEVEEGKYVVIRDEELEALEPEKTRDIDLRRFVDRAEIDPMFFDRAYFLTPGADSTKAYRLLAAALEETDRAGIATFVMRGKEYWVAILAEEGLLGAATLRFPAEIRSPEEVGLPAPPRARRKEVERFEKEIAGLATEELDPEELEDRYAARLRRLAAEKEREGEDVVEPASSPRPAERPVDLIETLRRRMQEAGPAGKPGRPARPVAARTPRRRAANERPTDERRPAMPPKAWSRKDERQYEHIKEGAKERGRSTDRAEEIAARTVNKQRREEGRTKSGRKTTSGTGNPNRSLEERSKQELYNRAKELDIGGRSQMSKKELVRAIRQRA